MRTTQSLILAALGALALAASACDDKPGGDGGNGDGGVGVDGDPGPCQGLACFQVDCPGATTTTVSGTVFAPNGTLPLYNVTVYVPNGTPAEFAEGVSCDRCDSVLSGDPLVRTTTDAAGHFVLENVPATGNVPIVVQVGKWRRFATIATVPECVDTELDAEAIRLPRNQSEGDIPQMALSTGSADALECLVRKIGLDDAEFTNGSGIGRVHLYAGVGGANKIQGGGDMADAQTLWANVAALSRYDVVFLSCEGDQNIDTKPAAALQAMYDYTTVGGRVFASHWHNYWIGSGPAEWPQVATFAVDPDLPDLGNDIIADISTGFDSAIALAQWLVNVGGSTVLGKIEIDDTQHSLVAVNEPSAYRWIFKDLTTNDQPSTQYMSFTTPLTVEEDLRCGKVVFSDIHVSTGDDSAPDTAFPGDCTSTGLTPQEKTLIFMIFDLASCVGDVIGKTGPDGTPLPACASAPATY